MRKTVLAAALVLLAACSGGADVTVAEEQVSEFHQRFNDNEFEAIYTAADPGFRQGTSKAEYTEFMSAVRRKLGRAETSERQGWNVHYGTGGTTISLSYQTAFEEGPGAESFVYLVDEGKTRLLSYNVNSRALVTN